MFFENSFIYMKDPGIIFASWKRQLQSYLLLASLETGRSRIDLVVFDSDRELLDFDDIQPFSIVCPLHLKVKEASIIIMITILYCTLWP